MNPRVGDVRRLLILVALSASVAGAIGQATPPRIQASVLAIGAGWAVVQADLSWRLEAVDAGRGRYRFMLRLGEFALLYLVAKLGHLAFLGWGAATNEVGGWPIGFVEAETIVTWVVMIVVWIGTSLTMGDLARLGSQGDSSGATDLPIPNLVRRWAGGGVLLVVASSIGLAGWSRLVEVARPPLVGLLVPGLIYFPIGVSVLSRVRLTEARAHWRRSRASVDPGVERRWATTATVGGLAVLAGLFLIPTGDATPIVAVVGGLFTVVGRFMSAIVRWLPTADLDGGNQQNTDVAGSIEPVPLLEEPDLTPIEPGEPLFSEGTTRLIQRGAFWLVIGAVLFLVVREIYRSRRYIATVVKDQTAARGLWAGMLAGLAAIPVLLWRSLMDLWGWFGRRRPEGDDELEAPSGRRGASPGWAVDHPVRARILLLYRRFLDAAADMVGARRHSETPAEYLGRVRDGVPDAEQEAGAITALFEEARYSGRTINNERVTIVEDQVEAVERAFENLPEDG